MSLMKCMRVGGVMSKNSVRGSNWRWYGSGDINRGGGKFGEREHAQEEQYFRKKEREEIEKYRKEMDKAAREKDAAKNTDKKPDTKK